MSDMPKFLADDHGRIRRSFNDYKRINNMDAALNVCDHLWIHLTIEVELAHPAVWNSLSSTEAEGLSAADDQISRLMETIDSLEPNDRSLGQQMTLLQRAVDAHIVAYDKYLMPKLRARPDQLEMGRDAFRRWQELFEERPPRTWRPMDRLANTGWGGGGRLPGAGW
ncbi:MAG: hypothetical protein M3083_10890 [Actinomycetota bacterium]|nr:hypothetical protein [Actinomycetota bacterium]